MPTSPATLINTCKNTVFLKQRTIRIIILCYAFALLGVTYCSYVSTNEFTG